MSEITVFNIFIACCLPSLLLSQTPHLPIKQPLETNLDIKIEQLKPFQEIEFQPVLQKNKIMKNNFQKFSLLRQYNLPIDQYAITGSGPLGIRHLKEIGDIDIIVTPELWDHLAVKYGITDQNGVKKITFPDEVVEAFREGSFYGAPFDENAPTIATRIANAEIIDGLPFDTMENILYFKCKASREKDLKDIHLIEEWMSLKDSEGSL